MLERWTWSLDFSGSGIGLPLLRDDSHTYPDHGSKVGYDYMRLVTLAKSALILIYIRVLGVVSRVKPLFYRVDALMIRKQE